MRDSIVNKLFETSILIASSPVQRYYGEPSGEPIDLRESGSNAGFWWSAIYGLATARFDTITRENHEVQGDNSVACFRVSSTHEGLRVNLLVLYCASGVLLIQATVDKDGGLSEVIHETAVSADDSFDMELWRGEREGALHRLKSD